MKNIIIDGVEYTPVIKETIKDDCHPGKYWHLKIGDMCYYIDSLGRVNICDRGSINSANYGNAFQTQEEAEKELAKRKAIVTIKRYISDTFGVFEPDWSNGTTDKYSFHYDNMNAKMSYTCSYVCMHYSPIGYLSCEEHAQEIIEKFDTELRIIFDIK